MQKIVITGANGYVASHLISNLLSQKHKVIALVRGNDKYSPAQRMKNVLFEIDDHIKLEHLDTCNYSLLEEDFSIPKKQLEDIFSQSVDFFHFAASLKFDAKDKDKIFETNVGGVENAMKVFIKHSKPGSRFFFVSSTYSCGNFSGLFEEKFYANEDITHFRNYYEQSKRFAENTVKRYMEEKGIDGHIVRLSQVVGDSRNGVTHTDYGVFDFVKRIGYLSEKYPGSVVRVRIDPDSTQNLIPINQVVDYFMKIVDTHKPLTSVFHFAAKNSIKNYQIIEGINRLLPFQVMMDKNLQRAGLSPLERMIAAGMSFTGSYAETNLLFETKSLDGIMPARKNELTAKAFYKMLEYFIQNELPVKKQTVHI
ncbi:NAD-dependent epimerase/dehydratase family protein [Mariniphaga sediminis]|uniref:NAD-dependent epimerase/dehydratase family protein n=1 Tax=Mariniphaga sediminis TaxID=1628158 RepID=A0A399D2C8_9BACT|nr:SDR family oxidoreductase [Mariniphaga sediminis]RIH65799.1 NAD-dependent epimerase/dehydratase family protein [Mariniphaga sediminis]